MTTTLTAEQIAAFRAAARHRREPRRPLSFYETRARERGVPGLVEAVVIMPDDEPRGVESLSPPPR